MEQDYIFYGYFKLSEEDNGLVIKPLLECQRYDQLEAYGTWYKGTLLVKADGNYVEADVQEVYEVQYSWSSFKREEADRMKNLVYIDSLVCEKTWFGLSERWYYPPHTRYIRDNTSSQRGLRRYFNHTVTLIVK